MEITVHEVLKKQWVTHFSSYLSDPEWPRLLRDSVVIVQYYDSLDLSIIYSVHVKLIVYTMKSCFKSYEDFIVVYVVRFLIFHEISFLSNVTVLACCSLW